MVIQKIIICFFRITNNTDFIEILQNSCNNKWYLLIFSILSTWIPILSFGLDIIRERAFKADMIFMIE